MNKSDIFDLVVRHTRQIVPTLVDQSISPGDSLKALGANSLDRSEIVMMTLEAMEITMPLAATAGAKNIGDLVNLLHENF